MPVILVASWRTLIQKAHNLGRARKEGNLKKIQLAEDDLRAYEAVVRIAESMILD